MYIYFENASMVTPAMRDNARQPIADLLTALKLVEEQHANRSSDKQSGLHSSASHTSLRGRQHHGRIHPICSTDQVLSRKAYLHDGVRH